jgi:hypothetical protein
MNNKSVKVILDRMEQNSCRGKKEYFSIREASDRAVAESRRIGEELMPYQCPFCFLFHLGHRPTRNRIEAERKLKQYGIEVGNFSRLRKDGVSL